MPNDQAASSPVKKRTKQPEDIIGLRFGRLLVVGEAKRDKSSKKLLCLCDCGEQCVVRRPNLLYGGSRSCGCLRAEISGARTRTHGMSKTAIYKVWCGMIERCENPLSTGYHKYGARGVRVCERWKSFDLFYKDMGPRPTRKHSIDRVDNNGPYAPDNCRWATAEEQQSNTRKSVRVAVNGCLITAAEAERVFGINRNRIYSRIRSGRSIDDLILK
jgi:hypothetical protein